MKQISTASVRVAPNQLRMGSVIRYDTADTLVRGIVWQRVKLPDKKRNPDGTGQRSIWRIQLFGGVSIHVSQLTQDLWLEVPDA